MTAPLHLPWHLDSTGDSCEVCQPNGDSICLVHNTDGPDDQLPDPLPAETAAKGQFIVQACNAHQALTTAAQEAHAALTAAHSYLWRDEQAQPVLDAIASAVAKVRGALDQNPPPQDANPPNGIPQLLLQVSHGVLNALISTRPVAVFLYDWDNIKAGGHEAVESDVNGFRQPVTEDSALFHKEALDCFKQAKEIHERSL